MGGCQYPKTAAEYILFYSGNGTGMAFMAGRINPPNPRFTFADEICKDYLNHQEPLRKTS